MLECPVQTRLCWYAAMHGESRPFPFAPDGLVLVHPPQERSVVASRRDGRKRPLVTRTPQHKGGHGRRGRGCTREFALTHTSIGRKLAGQSGDFHS